MKFFASFASISGLLAVVLGAFGAHGLKGKIADPLLSAYATGVQYHFYHTLALLFVVVLLLLQGPSRLLGASAGFFIAGIVAFSGSLYLLALGGPKWLGPVTPLGGLCFMVGWVLLAAYFLFSFSKSASV
nr:DUF423 domain-containing protein [Halioxenophilus sp. WMMB6]